MKRSRKLRYLFKEGVHNMFSHGFTSFAAICATVACLIIIGSFSLIIYNLSLKVDELEQQNRVLAFIDESYSTAEAKSVGSKINQIDNVHEAVFVTGEEAGEAFILEQGGGDIFAGVDPSFFLHRFVITLEDNSKMTETVKALEAIPGVYQVNSRPELADGFTELQNILNIASIAIAAMLLVVSLFMISNTIKLAMYDRRDEIGIMKMIGATNRFIRFPYFVEGFLIGLFSGVVAFFLEWGIYDLLRDRITKISQLQLITVVPFREVLWTMVATFGITGLLVGILGSVLSIRKFLDV